MFSGVFNPQLRFDINNNQTVMTNDGIQIECLLIMKLEIKFLVTAAAVEAKIAKSIDLLIKEVVDALGFGNVSLQEIMDAFLDPKDDDSSKVVLHMPMACVESLGYSRYYRAVTIEIQDLNEYGLYKDLFKENLSKTPTVLLCHPDEFTIKGEKTEEGIIRVIQPNIELIQQCGYNLEDKQGVYSLVYPSVVM